eukprot:3829707-Pyramimonas_sp.AAC.1
MPNDWDTSVAQQARRGFRGAAPAPKPRLGLKAGEARRLIEHSVAIGDREFGAIMAVSRLALHRAPFRRAAAAEGRVALRGATFERGRRGDPHEQEARPWAVNSSKRMLLQNVW